MCPPNEWMRAANNDGDDDKEEEEVKGAEIQVSVLIQASVRINSFKLMTRLCVRVGVGSCGVGPATVLTLEPASSLSVSRGGCSHWPQTGQL